MDASPSKWAGMPWDAWANCVEANSLNQSFGPSSVNKSNECVMTLPKSDMEMFGLCPEKDPLVIVSCEVCHMLVKTPALLLHYQTRHGQILQALLNPDESAAEGEDMAVDSWVRSFNPPKVDAPVVESSLKHPLAFTLSAQQHPEHLQDSKSETGVVPKTIHHKNSRFHKRAVVQRKPLNQLCANSWQGKKKEVKTKKQLNQKIPVRKKTTDSTFPMARKMADSVGSPIEMSSDNSLNSLLQQLPELNLNGMTVEPIETHNSTDYLLSKRKENRPSEQSDSVPFICNQPRALSTPPLFSCHKIGGLFYPSRQMKTARQGLQFCIDNDINVPTSRLDLNTSSPAQNSIMSKTVFRRKKAINRARRESFGY